jgi:hypothetical protein
MRYETYDGQQIDLAVLNPIETEFLAQATEIVGKGAKWAEFQNFYVRPESPIWYVGGNEANGRLPGEQVPTGTLALVLTDMWLRLGEQQGMLRLTTKVS